MKVQFYTASIIALTSMCICAGDIMNGAQMEQQASDVINVIYHRLHNAAHRDNARDDLEPQYRMRSMMLLGCSGNDSDSDSEDQKRCCRDPYVPSVDEEEEIYAYMRMLFGDYEQLDGLLLDR